MYTIALNSAERELCYTLASKRYSINRHQGVKGYNNWATGDRRKMLEVMGIAGELALAKILKTYFQVSQDPNERLKEGDLEHNGRWIDVKTSDRPDAWLNCPHKSWTTPTVAVYALVTTDSLLEVFQYVGYALASELIHPGNLKPGRVYGENKAPDYYTLPPNRLRKELP